ncbi:MAG: thiamine-phosphate kinase [Gallionella sp.]|nr:thiamine-phosphate kinase [Gallionella sp.]
MSEFGLIRRFFTRATPSALLGVGDDAALLQPSAGNVLAVSTDMLVSGTHFLPDADPCMLGHKTLAVNISDMAAMGAIPRWATLGIALPSADEAWLEKFSAGFFALAQQHGVDLVGGDTTRGPLNLCVTIIGEVPASQALRRSGAQVGDEIWVSGTLGDAALALAHLQGRIVLDEAEYTACAPSLHQPQPRVALGLALRGIASSAIDISDGLLGDLGHILEASQVAAEIRLAALPVSAVLRARLTPPGFPMSGEEHSFPPDMGGLRGVEFLHRCVLSGGDDYELCFTAPRVRHAELLSIAAKLGLPLTHIGEIGAGRECIVHDVSGNPIKLESSGYDHFR